MYFGIHMPLPVAQLYKYTPRPEWGGYYPLGIDVPSDHAAPGVDASFMLALVSKSRLPESKDISMVHYSDPQVLRLVKCMCSDRTVVQTWEIHDIRDALSMAIDRSRTNPPPCFDMAWIPLLEAKLRDISELIDTYVEQNVCARTRLRNKRLLRDLMGSAWNPLRMNDWCLDEEEKKELAEDGCIDSSS